MIEDSLWNAIEKISQIEKKSISKIINESMENTLQKYKEENLAFKLQMALDSVPYIDEDEEREIIEDLKALSEEDLKIVKREQLFDES